MRGLGIEDEMRKEGMKALWYDGMGGLGGVSQLSCGRIHTALPPQGIWCFGVECLDDADSAGQRG